MKTVVPYLTIRSVAKGLIAAFVLFGLFHAIHGAVEDVLSTNNQVELRAAEIEQRLSVAESLPERQKLLNELEQTKSERISWTSLRIVPLLGAIALNMLGLFLAGEYWRNVLHRVGATVPWRDAQEAYFLGHLAKYSPGKALTVIVRVERLKSIGVPRTWVFTSVLIETLNFMAVGALVGCAAAFIAKPPVWMIVIACVFAVTALLLTCSDGLRLVMYLMRSMNRLIHRVVGRSTGSSKTMLLIEAMFAPYTTSRVTSRSTVEGWLLLVISWLLLGVALFLSAHGVVSVSMMDAKSASHFLSVAIAVAGLSTVLGFLSFLPGGVGARELVVFTLLGPVIGMAPALATAVVNRLCAIVAELLSYLLFKKYAIRKSNRKSPLSAVESTT